MLWLERDAAHVLGHATCEALVDSGALKTAEGFVIVASVVKAGDVMETLTDLQTIEEAAPVEFHTALSNIIDVLVQIDAGATAGDGRTIDTSAVQPDANLLAGMCRSRGAPIPAVY